jgi:hypothetical protein
MNSKEVATFVGVTGSTVGKWRRPFIAQGLKCLDDADRPGRPRTVRHPPERAVVLCADEKSNIQALNRSAPLLPMMPADPPARPHDYIRHATSSLFAALDMATGTVMTRMHRRHRALEFKSSSTRSTVRSPPTSPGT